MVRPARPSTMDLIVPSMMGFDLFFFMAVNGSHSISLTALFIENLNTWSENFNMNTAVIDPNTRNPAAPKTKVTGKNINEMCNDIERGSNSKAGAILLILMMLGGGFGFVKGNQIHEIFMGNNDIPAQIQQ